MSDPTNPIFPSTMKADELLAEVQAAEKIASAEPDQGIAKLLALSEHATFFPWGAHTLIKLLRSRGRESEAGTWSQKMFVQCPTIPAAWQHYCHTGRMSEAYCRMCGEAVAAIGKGPAMPPWFKPTAIELALALDPVAVSAFTERCVADGILDAVEVAGIHKLSKFLAGVRDALAKDKKLLSASGWRIGFFATPILRRAIGGEKVCRLVGDCVEVNLSPLALQAIEGWEKPLAEPLAVTLISIFHFAAYADDTGVGSWTGVIEKDAFTSTYWIHLRAQILKLAQGVRSARTYVAANFLEHGLWVRPGNVELWAIWNRKVDPAGTSRAAVEAAEFLQAQAATGQDIPLNDLSWPRIDPKINILRLSTNAGWYARPDKAAAAFDDWADRYAKAMSEGRILSAHTDHILRICAVVPGLRANSPYEFNDRAFASLLSEKSVVVVSSFAEEIRQHAANGKLALLWHDLGLPKAPAAVATVEAPMSIWPYFPDESWSVTFERLCDQAEEAVRREKAQVFTASCGAYGLPLSLEIHKRCAVRTVYWGHATNMFFGMQTNAFAQAPLFLKNPTSPHWHKPQLQAKYPAIVRIDQGRYVA